MRKYVPSVWYSISSCVDVASYFLREVLLYQVGELIENFKNFP